MDENTNKNGELMVERDYHGRVVSGVLNPNGRPKKGHTLTDAMREYLENTNEKTGRIRRDEFVQKVATMAYEGDPTALKLIWNYLEGMPPQKLEHSGAIGITYQEALKLLKGETIDVHDGSTIPESETSG